MASAALATIRSNIQTLIAAQLSGVTIHRFPVTADEYIDQNTSAGTQEWVELGDIRWDRNHGSIGGAAGKLFDTVIQEGRIAVLYAGGAGQSNETKFDAAFDRAETLLDGVLAAVDGDRTLSGTAVDALVESGTASFVLDDRGHAVTIEWQISVETSRT